MYYLRIMNVKVNWHLAGIRRCTRVKGARACVTSHCYNTVKIIVLYGGPNKQSLLLPRKIGQIFSSRLVHFPFANASGLP